MNAPLALAPHEIVASFHERTHRPTQAQIDALLRRGLDRWAIAGHPGSGEHAVGFARIELDPPHFEFAGPVDEGMPPAGVPAMVVVALNEFAEPADIVAWPLKGDGVGAWLGTPLLGRQHVTSSRIDPALNVYPTGFDWLRGDRGGVVLVDPERAARELWNCGPFRAADVDHGLRLQAVLMPPVPSVVIDVSQRIAA